MLAVKSCVAVISKVLRSCSACRSELCQRFFENKKKRLENLKNVTKIKKKRKKTFLHPCSAQTKGDGYSL